MSSSSKQSTSGFILQLLGITVLSACFPGTVICDSCLESGQPGTSLLSRPRQVTLLHHENIQFKNQTPAATIASPILQLTATKRTKQNGKVTPLWGGNSLCCQAINDKLSQAVPSAWPASLQPPPCQHPPSSSPRVGPLCGENSWKDGCPWSGKGGRRVLEGQQGKVGRGR